MEDKEEENQQKNTRILAERAVQRNIAIIVASII